LCALLAVGVVRALHAENGRTWSIAVVAAFTIVWAGAMVVRFQAFAAWVKEDDDDRRVPGRPERPEQPHGSRDPQSSGRRLVVLTWVIPGLGHLALGRWEGGVVVVAYVLWAGLALARAIPFVVWVGPAFLVEIAAQVAIARLAGIDWRKLLD
jgi:hypothetical protein